MAAAGRTHNSDNHSFDDIQLACSICGAELPNPGFARNYPNFVCRECDARAVNQEGNTPRFESMHDDGDNPVFIDGIQCWRRYRYGGFITMRDDLGCHDIGEFYDKHDWIGQYDFSKTENYGNVS